MHRDYELAKTNKVVIHDEYKTIHTSGFLPEPSAEIHDVASVDVFLFLRFGKDNAQSYSILWHAF